MKKFNSTVKRPLLLICHHLNDPVYVTSGALEVLQSKYLLHLVTKIRKKISKEKSLILVSYFKIIKNQKLDSMEQFHL